MTDTQVLQIGVQTMMIVAKLSAPILLTTLAVGFLISLFQSVTQIQEQTLSFVPKLLAMAAVLVVLGPWMGDTLLQYTRDLWLSIPSLVNH